MDKTDIDILVPDDEKPPEPATPAADAKASAADKKPEPKVLQPDEGLEQLKAQLDAEKAEKERERTARLAAEAAARSQADAVAKAQNETQDANVQLVTTAIETVKQAQDSAKQQYAAALAAQDYGAAADIQAEMSTNAAKLVALENGLQALKNAPKAEPKPIIAPDPVEQLAGQLSPRSAAWVRAHPQYARDGRLFQAMLGAHNVAMGKNLEVDTDAYFADVERSLGIQPQARTDAQPSDDDALSDAATPAGRRQSAPAAAPPSNRGGNGANGSARTVRLSADEREMAAMMGLTDEEYARNKLALQKEGRLN